MWWPKMTQVKIEQNQKIAKDHVQCSVKLGRKEIKSNPMEESKRKDKLPNMT